MSEHFLNLIPADPDYVPAYTSHDAAALLVAALAPLHKEIRIIVEEHPRFIDAGESFESVACPWCDHDLMAWWSEAMGRALQGGQLTSLLARTPCCQATTSLHDLHYKGPQGFARFCIEVRDPGVSEFISAIDLQELEAMLGCRLRQIFTHY